jgi:hypothetical protein
MDPAPPNDGQHRPDASENHESGSKVPDQVSGQPDAARDKSQQQRREQPGPEGALNQDEIIQHLASLPLEQRQRELSDPRIPSGTREGYLRAAAQIEQAAAAQPGSAQPRGAEGWQISPEQVASLVQMYSQADQKGRRKFISETPQPVLKAVFDSLQGEEKAKMADEIASIQASAEANVHATADYAEHAVEGEEYDSGDEEVVSDRKKYDASVMAKILVPESEDARRRILETHADILHMIGDKTNLDPDQSKYIAGKLHTEGIRKDQEGIDDWLKEAYPTLNDPTREEIKRNLEDSNGQEQEKEISEEDRAIDKAMPEWIERTSEMANESETALAANNDLTPEEKAKITEDIGKARGKLTMLGAKLQDFFAEGEPGRKAARRGAKILYYALLTAFILLVIEMNIINKAAKASGGQRR